MRSSANPFLNGLVSMMATPSWEIRGEAQPGSRLIPVLGIASLVAIWWIMSFRFDVAVLPSPVVAFEETQRLMVGGELIGHALVDDPTLDTVVGDGGAWGRGGMRTKLHAARLAARSATSTIIASSTNK